MHGGDSFGFGMDEVFVAPFVLRAAKVFGGEVLHLQVGSHGTVQD